MTPRTNPGRIGRRAAAVLLLLSLAPPARPTTVVLVSPTEGYFDSFLALVEGGQLAVPDLELVLALHAGATHDGEAIAARLAAGEAPYARLEVLDCPLTAETLWSGESCAEAYRALFEEADGFLFLGGDDIAPALYGEPTRLLSGETNPGRHRFELSLLARLLGTARNRGLRPLLEERPGLPVVGFCLGLQSQNVAAGGTLVQDIPSELYGADTQEDCLALPPEALHRNPWKALHPEADVRGESWHPVVFADSALAAPFGQGPGDTLNVFSWHHQAIGELAPDYEACARSLDGRVIEAIRHRRWPRVFGTQFHVEFSDLYDEEGEGQLGGPDDPEPKSARRLLEEKGSLEAHRRCWRRLSAELAASAAEREAGTASVPPAR